MKSHLVCTLAALALLTTATSPRVHAQTLTGSTNQPPVSPYLNILRGGAPAGVNYYNLVQPQLQFYSAINQLQTQQQQQAVSSYNASGALVTGHPIQFANVSHFYPSTVPGARGSTTPTGGRVVQNPSQQNAPIQPLGTGPRPFPLRTR